MSSVTNLNPEADIIQHITHIRARNNILWMEILKIALSYAPDQTKVILNEIKENDHRISTLTWQLIQ